MASREDKSRRFYSTEEVLAYLHADSTSDSTPSEGSEDNWETDSSNLDEKHVSKRSKFPATSHLPVRLLVQQTNSKCTATTVLGNIIGAEHADNTQNEATESEIELSEESSITSDSSSEDEEDDSDWSGLDEVHSTVMLGGTGNDGKSLLKSLEQEMVDSMEQGVVDTVEEGVVDTVEEWVVDTVEEGVVDVVEEGVVGSMEEGVVGSVQQGVVDSVEQGVVDAVEEGMVDVVEEGVVGSMEEGVVGSVQQGVVDSVEQGVVDAVEEVVVSNVDTSSNESGNSYVGVSRGGRGSVLSSRGRRGSRGRCGNRGRRGTISGNASRQGQARSTDGVQSIATPITQVDSNFVSPDAFQPLRIPGPHLPDSVGDDTSELGLFRLFFDDSVLERLVTSTNDYADKNQSIKPNMYKRFKRHPLTPDEIMRYLGCLLLLSISSVRNYCSAWSKKSSQHLSHLPRLLTRDRFQAIGAFLHVVTAEEESSMSSHRLKKILPLHDVIKRKCLDLYQPLQQLSVDERMVKSKARTHFRQYIRNKPTKWGYKYWVLADPTGYTVDFDIYYGTSGSDESSGKGLGYDVVKRLTTPFHFQGYEIFCDNFYSSSTLFVDLLDCGIPATGTVRTNRMGTPKEVKTLKEALDKARILRGTGYYIRPQDSPTAYIVWKDGKCVTVLTTAYPGHSTGTVKRRVKTNTGVSQTQDVPIPIAIEKYNAYMGGVDKSDQFISYNRVLRKTVRYWKTFFYHLIEIVATNSAILYNWRRMEAELKKVTHTAFLDALVQQIIGKYGRVTPESDDFMIMHGSQFRKGGKKSKCVYCHTNKTLRFCPDCSYEPSLCQVPERDCHSIWHQGASSRARKQWFKNQTRGKAKRTQKAGTKRGRPAGSTNLKKRRGQYKEH